MTAMHRMSTTKFGVDIQVVFLKQCGQTSTHTERDTVTDTTDHPTHTSATASMGKISTYHLLQFTHPPYLHFTFDIYHKCAQQASFVYLIDLQHSLHCLRIFSPK